MSPAAAARMTAMLPGLLSAVRWRRRRRHAARAGVAALLVAGALFATSPWWSTAATGPDPAPGLRAPAAPRAAPFAIVRTAPDVVARYRCDAQVPADWFIDDDELQRWLRQDGRPDGLVRVAGRVTVVSAAVDAFPVAP